MVSGPMLFNGQAIARGVGDPDGHPRGDAEQPLSEHRIYHDGNRVGFGQRLVSGAAA